LHSNITSIVYRPLSFSIGLFRTHPPAPSLAKRGGVVRHFVAFKHHVNCLSSAFHSPLVFSSHIPLPSGGKGDWGGWVPKQETDVQISLASDW